jgi:hypothetical protein
MAIALLILIVAVPVFVFGMLAGYSIAAKRAAAEHRETQADLDKISAEAHAVAARLSELGG